MSHQPIEQVFPAEVATYGQQRVWDAWRWVCTHRVIEGQTTLGEAKRLTRERLQHSTEAGKDTPPG